MAIPCNRNGLVQCIPRKTFCEHPAAIQHPAAMTWPSCNTCHELQLARKHAHPLLFGRVSISYSERYPRNVSTDLFDPEIVGDSKVYETIASGHMVSLGFGCVCVCGWAAW
eukprot:scaffold208469_cov19-Tisochrysis_lutea.AAC.2